MEAHEITSTWSDTTVSWNHCPTINTEILDYDFPCTKDGANANNRWYTWDISQLVDKWHTEGNNYGIMLKYPDGYSQNSAVASFISANGSPTANRPMLNITFLSMIGLEDYWTYHSQDAGLAGSGYINDFTGALTTVFNDVELDSERLPMTISHVYRSYKGGEKESTLNVGQGFKLSIQESVKKVTLQNKTKYLYVDGDGTEHYFEKNNNDWVDDSGLDLKLTIGTSEYTITDKKDNKRVFSVSQGYLLKIIDNHGNTTQLNYENHKLKSISDASGRTVQFKTDSNNILTEMVLPDGRSIYYEYTNVGNGYDCCLSKVTFPGGNVVDGGGSSGTNDAQFLYNSNGSLTDLIDGTKDMGIHYDYTFVNNKYRRVNGYSVRSYLASTDSSDLITSQYTIEYKPYHNTFREILPNAGRSEIYKFNHMGQTISAQDQDGNAIFCAMGMSGGAKNKVTFASKTQKTITNFLWNHSFESGMTNYTDYGKIANVKDSSAKSFVGSKSLEVSISSGDVESGAKQTVTVPGGKVYTFSAYVNTTVSGGAFLKLEGGGSTSIEEDIEHNDGFKRFETTIDLTNISSSVQITATVGVKNVSGKAYFDCLQLEEGQCANRYNMIENGGFEGDEGLPGYTHSKHWSQTNAGIKADHLWDGYVGEDKNSGSLAYHMSGSPKYTKKLSQTIPVNGKKGEGLVFGTWVKTNGLPNKDTNEDGSKQSVGMTLELITASGTSQYANVLISPTSDEWVYICKNMIANSDFTSVKIHLKVNYNANTTFFDDVQVYKDSFGESFNYDAKGNIISVVDMAQNTENAAVNGNNDMTTYKDGMGNQYSFQYDNASVTVGNTTTKKHDLTRSTAPDGSYTAMSYYSEGPIHFVSVYDKNGKTAIRTEKTYDSGKNYLVSSKDQLQKTTTYNYNSANGLLNSVTEPCSNGQSTTTTYTYDTPTQKLTNVSKEGLSVSYGYTNDDLSSMQIGSANDYLKYSFTYSRLGNLTSVSRSSHNSDAVSLETYEYDEARGNQTKVTYGNGGILQYEYDLQDRLIKAIDTSSGQNVPLSQFFYNANGLLGKVYSYDIPNEPIWAKYQYDFAERFTSSQTSWGFGTHDITYDKNNNNTGYTAALNGLSYKTTYAFNNVNNMNTMKLFDGKNQEIARELRGYDGSGRLITTQSRSDVKSTSPKSIWTSFTYLDPQTGVATNANSTHTTNLPYSMNVRFSSLSTSSENPDYRYVFSYDNASNIKSIDTTYKNNSTLSTDFTYTKQNWLSEAYGVNDQNDHYTYLYDTRGNITHYNASGANVEKAASYTYNANIPDELQKVVFSENSGTRTRDYTYDVVGNPTSIVETNSNGGTTERQLSWVRGKDLRSVSFVENGATTKTNTYYYNESGQRAKIVSSDGSYTRFHYDSDLLEYEERYNASGTLTAVLKYFYDDDDKVSYVLYKTQYPHDGTAYYSLYYYLYNALGEITDVFKIQSPNNTLSAVHEHVAHYEYDPYGHIVSLETKNGDNFGNINPIRYKGYYYDTDLGWYHLTTRYYDPSICRFINADDLELLLESPGDLTDKNLYSYCDNNPVMRADSGGDFWHVLIGAAVSAAVELGSQLASGDKVSVSKVVGAAVEGAASSLVPGKKAFEVTAAVLNGLKSGYQNYKKNKSVGKALVAGTVSAGLSYAGGNSAKKMQKQIDGAEKRKIVKKVTKKVKNKKPKRITNIRRHPQKRWSLRSSLRSTSGKRYGAFWGNIYGAGVKIIFSRW